jgi:lysozyme
MKKILLFLLASSFVSAQSYEEYKAHFVFEEGKRNYAYADAGGKSIGIGHFIQPHEDIDYLNDEQIDAYFRVDLRNAINNAKSLIPNFDKHDKEVKIILVSMAFNLGYNGFYKFLKFRKAINNMDYDLAIVELSNSKWAKQVPNRAKRAISVLSNAKNKF